ncbi:MAG TPA: relaxase/mobilization nuclease domain-containing protein, partial [Alphaproteobacteria bacterium]|nr:relaxase/mobilization nuclease domain-containing protein [Alphaproteobacteria bacterium]
AREMSRELSVARRLREGIERPVWHTSLSLPKGERLDTERWNKVCLSYLARMGIIPPEETQWTAWRHTDGQFDHVHIVVNRISLTGAVWDAGLDVYRAITATREIEKSFGLTITPGREAKKFAEPSLKRGEVERGVREGKAPAKVVVSDALKLSLEGKPDTRTFVRRMQEYGVDAVPNIASTGRMNGFSFAVAGIAVKGSDVGAAWKYLREAIDYDVQRDDQFLFDLKRRTAGIEKSGRADSFNPHGYDGNAQSNGRKD